MKGFQKRKKSRDGYRHTCKDCVNQQQQVWRDANRDAVRKSHNQHNSKETRKEYRRNWRLQAEYGISIEDYTKLLESQGGRCAICGTTDWGCHEKAFVDHDHTTGGVRGLLCSNCNAGLGMFRDNVEYLTNAINYLRETK